MVPKHESRGFMDPSKGEIKKYSGNVSHREFVSMQDASVSDLNESWQAAMNYGSSPS